MRISRRFINFALLSCMFSISLAVSGCKGRTAENMVPSGDTIEVVIMQDTGVELNNNITE